MHLEFYMHLGRLQKPFTLSIRKRKQRVCMAKRCQSEDLELINLPLKLIVLFAYIRPALGTRASQWVLDRGPLFDSIRRIQHFTFYLSIIP